MIQTILLDVEGTISPASYRYDVLLPYAWRHFRRFLYEHLSQDDVRSAIAVLRQKQNAEPVPDPSWNKAANQESLESVVEYCRWLVSQDRSCAAVKTVQDLIWRQGYVSGELCSEIFADVPPAFKRWRSQNLNVAIYSADSVLLQKLFFRYTEWGDLTPYINFFLGADVGPKRIALSYERIVRELQSTPEEILFVADATAALDAARETGIATALAVRGGDASFTRNAVHRVALDLGGLVDE